MDMKVRKTKKMACLLLLSLLPVSLHAHCDAWDGPVVTEAREALQAGDVAPVLKWVSPAEEARIVEAFARASAVSGESQGARELAELWFLETLVRIHREGEGAPYTGLKPAGEIDQAVQWADEALVEGSAEALAQRLSRAVAGKIEERFAEASRRQVLAGENPEVGREFVAAYVEYIHFVEALHQLLSHGAHGH
jgi:hypothetical protein